MIFTPARGSFGWLVAAALVVASASCSSEAPQDGSEGGGSANATLISVYPSVAENIDPEVNEGDRSRWLGHERGGMLFGYGSEGLAGQGCDELAQEDDLVGLLAESWEFSEEDSAYIVKLRDAQSQFGNQLTTEDVAYTYERIAAVEGISARLMPLYSLDPKNVIEVIDDKTFKLKVLKRSSLNLAGMTWQSFGILDSKAVKEHATAEDPWASNWLAKNTATFGPWTVSEEDFEPSTQITLRANENFYGERGNVRTVIMRAVPEAGTRLQLLQAGEAHYAARLSLDQYPAVQDDPNLDVLECVSADTDVVGINHADPTLSDPRVRKAISLALDREVIARDAYRGFAEPAQSGLSSHYPQSGAPELRHDPDAARAALAEAGHEDGLSLTLAYTPLRPGPEAEQVAILVQSQLRAVGVDVALQTAASAAEFEESTSTGKYQMWVNLLPPAVPDVAYSSGLYFSSNGGQNYFNYSNAQLDNLIQEVATLPAGDERAAVSGRISTVIAEDLPAIPLVEKKFLLAVSSNVGGVVHRPNGELYALEVTLDKD